MQVKYKNEIKEEDKITSYELIELLLKTRKIKDVNEFLNPTSPLKIDLNDFGFKKEIKRTLKILEEIKKNNQTIVVYTDYDADGITGGAILWETLHLLGFKVMPYVPHRKLEGYGFSKIGLDNIKKQYNPKLIISVDHGITAHEKIKYSKSIGIPVIVTDHHLKAESLPKESQAVFHIPELSGSGVAYFFAKKMFEAFSSVATGRAPSLQNNFETDYLALASIGTIADLVPLVDSSRSIVKYGLEAFSKVSRVGLKHILKEASIENRKITPYEVGYIIAPRINAVGRLEHAIDALRLLCTKKASLAYELACKIGKKNVERQDLVKAALDEARAMLEKKFKQQKNKIIILHSKSWHEGVIGLIASKLSDEYYRPVIIMTESNGFLKGSARSTEHMHITNFLRQHQKLLLDIGGHKQASGFSLEKTKLIDFIDAVQASAAKQIDDRDLEKIIEVDFKIPISKINLALVLGLEKLAPYGIGNPTPSFFSQAKVIGVKVFGKKQEHLKIYAKSNKVGSFPIEFIAFSAANKFTELSRSQLINLSYKLEVDRWGGSERVRGIVSGIA